MKTPRWTRRSFVGPAAADGAGTLAGCGGNAKTAALSSLQPAEARTRDEDLYRQHTEKDDRFCLNSLNFVPPAVETVCGTCKTVRGPINPDGWCKPWTKRKG